MCKNDGICVPACDREPLHVPAQLVGREKLFKVLVKRGTRFDCRAHSGRLALISACRPHRLSVMARRKREGRGHSTSKTRASYVAETQLDHAGRFQRRGLSVGSVHPCLP